MMHDPTFGIRLPLGLAALAVLAIVDYRRNPKNPARIKEYAFLFGVAACAMVYGLAHDFITHSISSEYFSIGKDMPQAADKFGVDVIAMALKASWSAGLFVGLSLLVANNPSKRAPQLSYDVLSRMALVPLLGAVVTAVALGLAVSLAAGPISETFGLTELNLQDSTAFVVTSGIHLGTYLGGLIGTAIAVVSIIRRRRSIAAVI